MSKPKLLLLAAAACGLGLAAFLYFSGHQVGDLTDIRASKRCQQLSRGIPTVQRDQAAISLLDPSEKFDFDGDGKQDLWKEPNHFDTKSPRILSQVQLSSSPDAGIRTLTSRYGESLDYATRLGNVGGGKGEDLLLVIGTIDGRSSVREAILEGRPVSGSGVITAEKQMHLRWLKKRGTIQRVANIADCDGDGIREAVVVIIGGPEPFLGGQDGARYPELWRYYLLPSSTRGDLVLGSKSAPLLRVVKREG